MIKQLLILIILFFSYTGYSQEEIITLYNSKRKVTKDSSKATFYQKLTKENDSLWLSRMYRRNNQLASYWYSKTKDSKKRIDKKVSFGLNDSISSILFYNNKGEKHGKLSAWFDNGNKSYEGRYVNSKKEGLWRNYFYSGEIAARAFFKNDSLITEKFYDKNGNERVLKGNCCRKKPEFTGGSKKYKKIVRRLVSKLKWKIKGTITVDYTISVTGDLTNIRIYDTLPDNLRQEIITFFKQIKGWKPAFNTGRLIPVQHSFKLIFE